MAGDPIAARSWRGYSPLGSLLPFACAALLALLSQTNAALSANQAADSLPRVIFTKEFPNSQPAYFSISIQENGGAVYSTEPHDDSPLEFQLPPQTAKEIFDLAGKLNLFRDQHLESRKRVANLGKKTLAYQKGAERYETSYNYTEVPEALALEALCERISKTEQHLLQLKYLLRFDPLGLVKELLQVEMDLDAGRLLGASQLEPLLEQVQKNRSLVHVAQERAGNILDKIHSGKY